MLRYILLGFLNRRERTGYELKSIMDQTTMHFWHAYHSQIYTTLRKLEEEGLLTSELEDSDDKLNRRTYSLTDAGRAELKQWLDTPVDDINHFKDELLVRIFFSDTRERQAVLDELTAQRQRYQQMLDAYQHIEQIAPLEGQTDQRIVAFGLSTLRFGIDYARMYLTWLDETITMVNQLD